MFVVNEVKAQAEAKPVWKNNMIYYMIAPLSVIFSVIFALSLQPITDCGIEGDMKGFLRASIIGVVACLLDIIFGFYENYLMEKTQLGYEANLKNVLMAKIFDQDITRFTHKDSSNYIVALTENVSIIAKKYFSSGLAIYKCIWSLVVSFCIIGYSGWELVVFAIVFSLISVILPKFFERGVLQTEEEAIEQNQRHISFVQDMILNFIPIKVYRQDKVRRERYKELNNIQYKVENKRNFKSCFVQYLSMGISELSYVLVIVFSVLLVVRGKVTIGYVMTVSQLLGGIMYPFETLPTYVLNRRTGKALRKELFKNFAPNQNRKSIDNVFNGKENEIIIDAFSYSCGEKQILKDLSLRLDLNKKYALIGKSGSGKSTLAKSILGQIVGDRGSVKINGVDVSQITEQELYSHINYQDQNATLFNDTIINNIYLDRPIINKNQILEKANLLDYVSSLEEKENMVVKENGINMSGGEKQRILFARNLVSNTTDFIVFDEALSSLDNMNVKSLEKQLLLQDDFGILMITHRINEKNMDLYDGVIVMEEGKVVQFATWKDIKNKEEFFDTENA